MATARKGAHTITPVQKGEINILLKAANTARQRHSYWIKEVGSILDDEHDNVPDAKEVPFEFRCDVTLDNDDSPNPHAIIKYTLHPGKEKCTTLGI